MSTVAVSWIGRIGETAGKVWHLLDEQGALPPARIVAQIDEPRDLVMQALGWLAREDKLHIDEGPRGKRISLKR